MNYYHYTSSNELLLHTSSPPFSDESPSTSSPSPPPTSTKSVVPKSLSVDDVLAGTSLLLVALLGLLLHAIEVVAMSKLIRKVIGFRFFMVLSIADVSLLVLFGIIPGSLVFFPPLLTLLSQWKHSLHTLSDTVWFSACYLNLFIALTRFACVVFPLEFRRLRRRSTCWLIGAGLWSFAFAQSWAMNQAPWFVTVWYAPDSYGMTCNWADYASSGTRTLYLTLNGMIIGAYLLIYASTALIIFTKRTIRFQFFATILGRRGSTSKIPSNSDGTNIPPEANGPKTLNGSGGGTMEVRAKRAKEQGQGPKIRTISVSRVPNGGEGHSLLGSTYSLEVRLVIPCCVSALIFVVAQLIIINGGIGAAGKWADLSIMLIFCLQSITPPILRFIFSTALREQIPSVLGLRERIEKRLNASAIPQQQQRLRPRIWAVMVSFVRKRSLTDSSSSR